MRVLQVVGFGLLVCLAWVSSSCRSPENQLRKADKEVYAILKQMEKTALGKTTDFAVDRRYPDVDPRKVDAKTVISQRHLPSTKQLTVTSLKEALKMAASRNRDFQRKKEDLFLSALSLSDARHAFAAKFSHTTEAERLRTTDKRDKGEVNTNLSVGKLLQSGGSIGLSLANNLFEYYSGDPTRAATSIISFNLVQPLLRGAGKKIAAESLTQAERNVIYEVRSFSRYQRTFAVDVATRYYRLIQQRDTVTNEYANYLSLVRARERAEALSKDRMPEFERDQTRQRELLARNRYIQAIEGFLADVDDFKILLGLTLDTPLIVTGSGLDDLRKKPVQGPTLRPKKAVMTALEKRLDFLNDVDRFEDAKRKIGIAEDALETDVELFANATLSSNEGDRKWERLNLKNWNGGVGFRFKLPLDRLLERNDYRREFIDFERQLRSLESAVDGVATAMRTGLRQVAQQAESYRIQQVSVDLAKRRTESAELLIKAGRASTRDLLEAQDDLISAQNALTRSLVDYHLARLRLLQDMGQLDLRDGGLVELDDVKLNRADGLEMKAGELPTPGKVFGETDTEDNK